MKRTIFLIAIGLFTFQGLNAQFSLGASGGINIPNIKQDVKIDGYDGFNTKHALYYFFGVIPKYNINSKLSVSTDIQYSLKGYMIDETQFMSAQKIQFIYLDVLPKVEYQIFEFLAVGLGFNIGLKLDEKIKIGENSWQSSKDFDTIKSSDSGVVGSVRGSFKNFFIIVSYNYGLQNIVDINYTDDNGESLDVSQYNRNLQIAVGYFFEFKKKE